MTDRLQVKHSASTSPKRSARGRSDERSNVREGARALPMAVCTLDPAPNLLRSFDPACNELPEGGAGCRFGESTANR